MIQQHLTDYVQLLQKKIDQYTSELFVHSTGYPSTLPALETVDKRLKEFVRLHHLHLLRACSYQKSKLNIRTFINRFSKLLDKFHLTTKQV